MKYNNSKTIISILVLIMLIASCTKQKIKVEDKKTEDPISNTVRLTDQQIKMSEIQIGSIETRLISNTLKINGEIAAMPQNTASVSMPMGGRIRSINVIPGSKVNKGQILAYIENYDFIELQQNYLETKSKKYYVGLDYQRQRMLYSNDASSKKNMQLIASEYNTLKIQLRGYEQKLLLIGINPSRLTSRGITRSIAIKSPISGYIKSVNAKIGSMVSATDNLFEVVNIKNLFIQLTVFDKDIDKLHKGQNISFYVNDEAESHHAIVYQTTKSIDNDRSYKVLAKIISNCGNILPGMYVNANVALYEVKKTALPDDAFVNYGGKDFIFICTGSKTLNGEKSTGYKMIGIRKGPSHGGYTQVNIPIGLRSDMVVTKGAYNILSALKNAGEED